ncbi:MAG: hypothetical protein ABW061_22090 [Polyangiaceae bacterium]
MHYADHQQSSGPLLVDWGANDRTLLNTSRADGPLVVRVVDGRVEPLLDCHPGGHYEYQPQGSLQTVDDVISDQDELNLKMPTFGANFKLMLQQAGELHVHMIVVGSYAAPDVSLHRSNLRGSCKDATAVATHVTVGAFVLSAGTRVNFETGVSAPVGAVEASAQASERVLNSAGDNQACAAALGQPQPPSGCSTSLQLFLTPVDESPAQDAQPFNTRPLGLAIAAAGVAGLGAGTVFYLVARDKRSGCASGGACPTQVALDRYNSGTPLLNASYISFAAGGVLTALGLIIAGPPRSDSASAPWTRLATARPRLQVTAAPGALALTGEF